MNLKAPNHASSYLSYSDPINVSRLYKGSCTQAMNTAHENKLLECIK